MQTRIYFVRGIVFSILILCLSSCGKQKPRVEIPGSPAPAAETVKSPEKLEPQSASTGETATVPTPDSAEAGPLPEKPVTSDDDSMGPFIRIGLITNAREVHISAVGGYYFEANTPEFPRTLIHGSISIRVEQGNVSGGRESCYRIQVLSLRSRESADNLVGTLEKTYKQPAVIRENSDGTSNRVRLGEFDSREQAEKLLQDLKNSDYPDAYIVEDERTAGGGQTTLALRGADSLFHLNPSGFLLLPSSDTEFLALNGKPYRGILDVRLNGSNRITVVNRLRMEAYLRGVVPAEMSPASYPEFNALAAQSIAARTYALKNMGRYESRGFDLTDDDNTQVYRGVAFENSATDEAIRSTAGIAVYYNNKLIDAMYSSTCGGRTEDISEVYDSAPVPYLKSVICATESEDRETGTTVTGHQSLNTPVLADDGNIANRELELAGILGLLESPPPLSHEYVPETLTGSEISRLIRNTGRIIRNSGKDSESSASDNRPATRIGFLQAAAETLFGKEQIDQNISSSDAAYYLDNLDDGDSVPENARAALAFLMQKSIWIPFSDNTVRPNDPVLKREALYLLIRCVEFIKPDILRQGTFVNSIAGESKEGETESILQIRWGNKVHEIGLAKNLRLFRNEASRNIPVKSLKLIGNEKTRFHVSADGTIDFLEVELNPTGASSDRYSPSATWEVTFSNPEIASKLKSLAGNIGNLKDLEPARIGKSGRVVRIRIIGSRTSVELNGYKVRGALGLRDTLYTLTRKKNPEGDIVAITFHGRGYGHGIGLCQVGAYGMAKAGKSYEEILKTYYRGVEIKRAY